MPKKPTAKSRPQFDAEPIDDDEQPPFTMDDDGYVTLRRPDQPAKKAKPKNRKEVKRGR